MPSGQYVDKDGKTQTINFHEAEQWLRSIDDDHQWQRPSTFDAKGVGTPVAWGTSRPWDRMGPCGRRSASCSYDWQ